MLKNSKRIKTFFVFLFILIPVMSFAQTMQSTSSVDWTTQGFESAISLDIEKAGIKMPSGRGTAVERINMQIPLLIKDALLSIKVNSFTKLEDLVLNETITLEELSQIIDNGYTTPSHFLNDTNDLAISHQISLNQISSKLISHKQVYQPKKPIERTASRAYSGIVIDARGLLPVQGEFIKEAAEPCLFPQIWDETMELLFERNMVNPEIIDKQGVVTYGYSENLKDYKDRVGEDPLVIKARKVYGTNRTDPVISRTDALKILNIPENIDLINQGKVVILLDEEKLVKNILVPLKDDSYYFAYNKIREALVDDDIAEPPEDSVTGIVVAIKDIKFQPESPEILPEEAIRLDKIAETIKDAIASNAFTILVEGHTARIGPVETELPLSIARARSIVTEMVKRGIPSSLFTYKGYGGNVPIDTNDTPEGRANNRRVVITLQPVFQFSSWY